MWRGEQVRERAASEVTKTPEPRLAQTNRSYRMDDFTGVPTSDTARLSWQRRQTTSRKNRMRRISEVLVRRASQLLVVVQSAADTCMTIESGETQGLRKEGYKWHTALLKKRDS